MARLSESVIQNKIVRLNQIKGCDVFTYNRVGSEYNLYKVEGKGTVSIIHGGCSIKELDTALNVLLSCMSKGIIR